MSSNHTIENTFFIVGVTGGFIYSIKILSSIVQDFKKWHYEYKEKQRKEQNKTEVEKEEFKNILRSCNENLSSLTKAVTTIVDNSNTNSNNNTNKC